MPREGHGSRNVDGATERNSVGCVMPREGHGSRNADGMPDVIELCSHAPRGAWE